MREGADGKHGVHLQVPGNMPSKMRKKNQLSRFHQRRCRSGETITLPGKIVGFATDIIGNTRRNRQLAQKFCQVYIFATPSFFLFSSFFNCLQAWLTIMSYDIMHTANHIIVFMNTHGFFK